MSALPPSCIYTFIDLFLSSWLMLSLKVSSIVPETMPATQFTKCCHVDLNCLQKRKWFMQICLFSAFVNQFFFTCTLLRVNRCNSKNSHLSFREQSLVPVCFHVLQTGVWKCIQSWSVICNRLFLFAHFSYLQSMNQEPVQNLCAVWNDPVWPL